MSDSQNNMVLYVGAYPSVDEANEDYDALVELHKEGWVGKYDVGIVSKDEKGKLNIKRHTDSTGSGTRKGVAIGAVLGLVFPPSIIASGIVGAGVGATIGHSMNDVSKDDLKEIGKYIEEGEAALVVVGELQIEKMIKKAVKKAAKEYQKEFNANVDDYNKELDEAIKDIK